MITTDPQIAVEVLARGDLCAIPTETVYGLAALASNEKAVAQVYQAKGRPVNHPLIVHVGSIDEVGEWISQLPSWAEKLGQAVWPGPLTLVGKRTAKAKDFVTGGQDTVAVRIPNHQLTLKVLSKLADLGLGGLVAPSANQFGHVSPTDAEHVAHDLGSYLDAYNGAILDGGRCTVGVESTIVLATGESPVVLRPGGITRKMISEITGIEVTESSEIPRVSGSLASHYSPTANVLLVSQSQLIASPAPDAGLIAFAEIKTPVGITRLASPKNIDEFAQMLYSSLRKADTLGLNTVLVVEPNDEGLAEAVRDRLKRAAN